LITCHQENRFFYVERHDQDGNLLKTDDDPGRAIYFIALEDLCCEDAHLMVDNLPSEELDMDGVAGVLSTFTEIMLVNLSTFGATVISKKVSQ
jgi:hypothetical protein